jgi:hypothetical protein
MTEMTSRLVAGVSTIMAVAAAAGLFAKPPKLN